MAGLKRFLVGDLVKAVTAGWKETLSRWHRLCLGANTPRFQMSSGLKIGPKKKKKKKKWSMSWQDELFKSKESKNIEEAEEVWRTRFTRMSSLVGLNDYCNAVDYGVVCVFQTCRIWQINLHLTWNSGEKKICQDKDIEPRLSNETQTYA